MVEPMSVLLRRSLQQVAAQAPAGYRRIVTELGPLAVEVDVDGEVFTVRGGGAGLDIGAGAAGPGGVRVGTSRRTVAAVLDGRLTLAEAVEADRIVVHGGLDDVLRAHDTLIAYAHAAVRAPSTAATARDLRGGDP